MKRLNYLAISSIFCLIFASCGTSKSWLHQPELIGYNNSIATVKKPFKNGFSSGNNFLLKNKQNLWELYIEGDPLERGLAIGSLTDSLLKKQEHVFLPE
jgi:hypothetical protein